MDDGEHGAACGGRGRPIDGAYISESEALVSGPGSFAWQVDGGTFSYLICFTAVLR